MSIEDFFNTTAVVSQVTNTTTGMGGNKKTYTTRVAALACRLSKASGNSLTETDEFGKLTIRNLWNLYCDSNSTTNEITESDKITIGSQDYDIQGIYQPGQLGQHLEIEMLEVR